MFLVYEHSNTRITEVGDENQWNEAQADEGHEARAHKGSECGAIQKALREGKEREETIVGGYPPFPTHGRKGLKQAIAWELYGILISMSDMLSYEELIREAREKQPPGSSPVFCLTPEICESPIRLAPEKFEKIKPYLRQIHFEHKSPRFTFSTNGQHITISVGALNLLWCASYAYFLAYQAFLSAQQSGLSVVKLGINQETIDALNLYDRALDSVRSERLESWPEQAPRPTPTPDFGSSIHVANEIFLTAAGWILLHEIGHIANDHPLVTDFTRSKLLENEADRFATEHALGGVSDPSVLLKRALGIAVANIVLLTIDISLQSDEFRTRHHPPTEERLIRNLRGPLLPESHPIHAFLAAMLQIHLTRQGVPHDLNEHATFSSLVDDFCSAMSKFRK